MTESTTPTEPSAAPWLHRSGDAAQGTGAPSQWADRLDVWQRDVTQVGEQISQELTEILSELSPGSQSPPLAHGEPRSVATLKDVGATLGMIEVSPDAVGPPPATIQPPATAAARSQGDDQNRLAALKERLAARLRAESSTAAGQSEQEAER